MTCQRAPVGFILLFVLGSPLFISACGDENRSFILAGASLDQGAYKKRWNGMSEDGMNYEPEIFKSVSVNTSAPNACSPTEPGPDWSGIIISAPDKIEIDVLMADKEIIPVCGYYQAEMRDMVDAPPMQIHVKNVDSGHQYKGSLLDQDESPEEPLPFPEEPIDPATLVDMLSASYFNPNVCDYVRFPLTSATYEIYVEYAGMQSNKVSVELVIN
ncbi:MAG: hypothetical protein CSB48_03585 [Proteobacteria bacterium]|nr:MAG: hypothetical protein CSB48_03585 [Pseudomonadota bacterium]